jgi:hypothetical protein
MSEYTTSLSRGALRAERRASAKGVMNTTLDERQLARLDALNKLFDAWSVWQEISSERTDCIDMLGSYIPRGQRHFRRRSGGSFLRLSQRSMDLVLRALFEKNAYATALASRLPRCSDA